jgi:hypothetical protein
MPTVVQLVQHVAFHTSMPTKSKRIQPDALEFIS